MPSIFIEEANSKFKVRARGLKADPVIGQKSRNFPSKAKAKAFKKKLQHQFASNDFSFFSGAKSYLTIGEVTNFILSYPHGIKTATLSLLKRISEDTPISSVPAENIDIINWYDLGVYMHDQWGNQPQTVAHYLSTLKTQLENVRVKLRYKIDFTSYNEATKILRRKGYIARSIERTRRPNELELTCITNKLKEESLSNRRQIPLLDIFEFAVETAARLGEICSDQISWQNYDAEAGTITIIKRKSPIKGRKIHSCFGLSPKAIKIIERQPRGNNTDPIFPYNKNSVSSAWRTTMKELNIQNLRFHDLRAEALCRLYELNPDPIAIMKVSGHRDLNILINTYLRLSPSYKGK